MFFGAAGSWEEVEDCFSIFNAYGAFVFHINNAHLSGFVNVGFSSDLEQVVLAQKCQI